MLNVSLATNARALGVFCWLHSICNEEPNARPEGFAQRWRASEKQQ
jgi:hypothetical protein